MSGVSQLTLPEEFYTVTSDRLLIQPEPQYNYARLLLDSFALSLSEPAAFGITPERAIGGVGAEYTPADKDRLMLANPLFREVFALGHDFKGGPGSTIKVNRPKYENTTYTKASRVIATGTSISTTPIPISSEQNNLTLYNFGGPYDQVNSRIAPFAVERQDAQMGVHRLSSIVGTHLVRDFHRTLDAFTVTLLDAASSAVYPDGMSAPNDATSLGSFPLTYEQVIRLEQVADQANMPTFPDGFRMAVLTTLQVAQLSLDPMYQRASQFFPEYSILFPGYVKSVGKTHIFKSTTLSIVNNSSSVPVHYGHYMGPGALMAGMGEPPRIAPSTDDNYGQTAKVVWIAPLALELANNTLVISVRSSG